MALEVLSGTVYQDSMKTIQKPRMEANVQSSTMNMNITEVAETMSVARNSRTGKDQDKGQKDNSPTEQQLKDAISKANNKLKTQRTRCEFSYHEETKRVSIKILDKETEEVIKEIPPEETLEMVEKMWELAGLLIDERR